MGNSLKSQAVPKQPRGKHHREQVTLSMDVATLKVLEKVQWKAETKQSPFAEIAILKLAAEFGVTPELLGFDNPMENYPEFEETLRKAKSLPSPVVGEARGGLSRMDAQKIRAAWQGAAKGNYVVSSTGLLVGNGERHESATVELRNANDGRVFVGSSGGSIHEAFQDALQKWRNCPPVGWLKPAPTEDVNLHGAPQGER